MLSDLLDTTLVTRKEPTTTVRSDMTDPSSPKLPDGDHAQCPVDHKTRATWLQQARAVPEPRQQPKPAAAAQPPPPPAVVAQQAPSSWSSWFRNPFSRATDATRSSAWQQQQQAEAARSTHPLLDESRVVSSIPRSSEPGPSSCPVNHEQETGASASGNWIYPSEKMFFEAMRRKGFDSAAAADMKTVVPIHNAVNERAWAEILRWEAPYVAPTAACGGPRLHSFAGLSNRMSPKARLNTLLGYTAPFDRHDWVVDRCGTTVEYVIDFYAGRSDGGGGKLNFYLDVRPKMNSWEGIKMRALRASGLS